MKRLTKYFILMVAMVVGVLTYGTSTFAMTAITPYTNVDGETIKWSAPTIKKCCVEETYTEKGMGATFMKGTKGLMVGFKETEFDSSITQAEIYVKRIEDDSVISTRILDINNKGSVDIYNKNGAMHCSKQKFYQLCIRTNDYFIGNYYILARVGNKDTKEYSEWTKYYVKTECRVKKSKKGDMKNGKCKIRWEAFPYATKYTVYAKFPENGELGCKWYKIGTTKKTSYTLKKIKGKKITPTKSKSRYSGFDVKIIPTVKNNKKYHLVEDTNPTKKYRFMGKKGYK